MPIFKTEKLKSVIEPEGFTCDKCKQRFLFKHYSVNEYHQVSAEPDFVAINHYFGYGSPYDTTKIEATLCEPCFAENCIGMGLLAPEDNSSNNLPPLKNKPIVHIDMDDTLCDFTGAWHKVKQAQPEVTYPQSLEGFFVNLDPIEGAVEAVNELRQHYDVYILTAPSYKNPLCYTEKRLWIEKHFDLEFTKNLIICAHKNLLKGDVLIDDYQSGKGQENFSGKLIHFGSDEYPNWATVKHALLTARELIS